MRRPILLLAAAAAVALPGTRVEAAEPEWLAGDLHVHSCYSHDSWCGPDDDNTTMDEAYTAGGTIEERFLEASSRGLDFLAITDHMDVRSQSDPGFGSHGVIGVPGYENSVRGHAQMLGATSVFDNGDASAERMTLVADELRAQGGLLQINHPADELDHELDATCSDLSSMHWRYGFELVPDTIEVWNIGHLLQPPMPAGTSNIDAIRFWECWLDRGHKIGATGGSDSHWLSTMAAQGPGNPTTWVLSDDRTAHGVLDGIRAGRTSISFSPPALGGPMLLLEADIDGDGQFESTIGDEVPPGTAMRVTADGLTEIGLVDVRANGVTILDDARLVPEGVISFHAPADTGWVRAELFVPDGKDERRALCNDSFGDETTYCRNALLLRAMTSAIYLR